MQARFGNLILGLAAALCLWDSITAPRGIESKSAAILVFVLAFLLLRRVLVNVPQSVTTVVGGCVLASVIVAGDRGLLDGNKPIWITVMMMGFLFFSLGDRIEKWLK